MTIHLGLDPGGSTGWALGETTARQPLVFKEWGVVKGGTRGFIEWWRSVRRYWNVDELVVEKFIMDGTITITDPCQIEGVILETWNGPLYWQKRDEKASLLPTETRRTDWFKRAGYQFGSSHAMDAATHLMVRLAKRAPRHAPTVRHYWPKP